MNIPKNVRVIAVSKLQSIDKIRALAESRGQKDFGENYVQEALPKITTLKHLNLNWHFIGRLQKNKLKAIVGNFELIHSVDSEELIKRIGEIAIVQNLNQKILLQLNLSEEETKGGFGPQDFEENFSEWTQIPGVQILGLMAMPPMISDVHPSNKIYFEKLRDLARKFDLKELSMGTSADYLEAIASGATMVRLGTILFGARP